MPTIDLDAAATPAAPTRAEYLDVDPKTLVLDENIRTDVAIDEHFLADIAEHGVETAIEVRRDVLGQLLVIDGQRRWLHAVKAGLTTVPVKVVDGIGDAEERIVRQYRLNEQRKQLTAAEKVAAVEQMALFGRTPKSIARKLGKPEAEVAAALAVAESKAAKAQLAEPAVDLAAAAVLAEFDDAPETVKNLAAVLAERGRGALEHAAAAERLNRARDAAVEARRVELRAQGVTVLDQMPDQWSRGAKAKSLSGLSKKPATEKTQPKALTADEHAQCPGHAVFVAAPSTYGSTEVKVVETPYCLDWRANGHHDRTASPKAASENAPEDAREERRRVRENNVASDAAVIVRRAFLADLLKRSKVPAGAVEHAALVIGRWPAFTSDYTASRILDEIWPDEARVVLDATPSATESTRTLLAYALAIGEAGLPRDFWRAAYTESFGYTPGGRELRVNDAKGVVHLRQLVAWGYTLSDVEAAWLDVDKTQGGDA